MNRRDRLRLWIVLIVVAAALAYSWPVVGKLNLGLDLKGGAHIVLQAKGTPENPIEDDSIDRLLAVLRNRVDQYGVAEPIIQKSGQDRIIIDLPGIQDPDAALELIGKTAQMDFREVIDVTAPPPPAPVRRNYDSDEQFARAQDRWAQAVSMQSSASADLVARAAGMEGTIVAPGEDRRDGDLRSAEEAGRYYLLGPVLLSGRELRTASVTPDSLGRMGVSLSFNDEGARLFEEATGRLIGRQIAIVLDGIVISAPVVQDRIAGGQAQITGRFSTEEATRLAIMLKAGALPVAVEIAENRSVGPSLGADSVRQGLEAGLFGAAMVLVFMLIYYHFRGLAADVALAVTILLIFAGLIAFNATLTLPGIAGIILTLGMAVDGNVLIYERIREETRTGKTPLAALDAGFRKALVTILDSNITTLIAALVLFYFGSGSVRGFGVTLSVGLVASVFANVVVTRALLQIFVSRKQNATKRGQGSAAGINVKFMDRRKPALALSALLVIASLGCLLVRGLNLGIDFTGGNVIQVEFQNRPDVAQVREVVAAVVARGAMIQNFGEKGIIIRTNEDTDQSREQVVRVLQQSFADMTVIGFEKVGPVVGRELRQQAFIGVSIALVAILIYITLRFQFRFAVVSVVPLVHDVIVALGFFSVTQMEISSSFIAALLTIVGYSLNNTIIILDRIRENWRDLSREGIVSLVNRSVNQTLARTINTTLTTLFPVVALCVWGGPVLQAFSYAMLVGIIAGTYSSMFVATGSLIEWWLFKPEKK